MWKTTVTLLLLLGCSVAKGDGITVSNVILTVSDDVDVPARETGPLASLTVAEGDGVKANVQIGSVASNKAENDVKRAQLEVDLAQRRAKSTFRITGGEDELKIANTELDRAKDAESKFPGTVSASDLDALRLAVVQAKQRLAEYQEEFDTAQLVLQVKQNDLVTAQQTLRRHQIEAPISGIVAQVHKRKGEWVKAGDAVVRILKLDELLAVGYIKSQLAARFVQGESAVFAVRLTGLKPIRVEGKIKFVSPEVNPVSGEVLVSVTLNNQDRKLRPGLSGDLQILEPKSEK